MNRRIGLAVGLLLTICLCATVYAVTASDANWARRAVCGSFTFNVLDTSKTWTKWYSMNEAKLAYQDEFDLLCPFVADSTALYNSAMTYHGPGMGGCLKCSGGEAMHQLAGFGVVLANEAKEAGENWEQSGDQDWDTQGDHYMGEGGGPVQPHIAKEYYDLAGQEYYDATVQYSETKSWYQEAKINFNTAIMRFMSCPNYCAQCDAFHDEGQCP